MSVYNEILQLIENLPSLWDEPSQILNDKSTLASPTAIPKVEFNEYSDVPEAADPNWMMGSGPPPSNAGYIERPFVGPPEPPVEYMAQTFREDDPALNEQLAALGQRNLAASKNITPSKSAAHKDIPKKDKLRVEFQKQVVEPTRFNGNQGRTFLGAGGAGHGTQAYQQPRLAPAPSNGGIGADYGTGYQRFGPIAPYLFAKNLLAPPRPIDLNKYPPPPGGLTPPKPGGM